MFFFWLFNLLQKLLNYAILALIACLGVFSIFFIRHIRRMLIHLIMNFFLFLFLFIDLWVSCIIVHFHVDKRSYFLVSFQQKFLALGLIRPSRWSIGEILRILHSCLFDRQRLFNGSKICYFVFFWFIIWEEGILYILFFLRTTLLFILGIFVILLYFIFLLKGLL